MSGKGECGGGGGGCWGWNVPPLGDGGSTVLPGTYSVPRGGRKRSTVLKGEAKERGFSKTFAGSFRAS